MTFDFSKIETIKKDERIIDPVDIFQKNKGNIADGAINDLWLGQGDALRDWNDNREKNDVAIVLNTGAGKTLIGLLVSQSLVNETKGKVLYACGSIQLIEQTREQAKGYGINVTTYYEGSFSNDLYLKGEAVCLTTYQAIFNGRSIFNCEDVDAIIFDDAHTAEGIIKNHFSLEFNRDQCEGFYSAFANIFRPYFNRVGKSESFKELCEGSNRNVVLLPPWEVKNNITEIQRILADFGVKNEGGNVFSWEYLKDHLDLCAYFLSSGNIQIVPPFIPINTLPYFKNTVRRVYLTATMLGEDAFIRTFGRSLDHIVQPKTTAGECERLILFPGQKFGFDNEKPLTKQLIENHKTLILTPSKYKAKRWKDVGSILTRQQVTTDVANFKNTSDPIKIVLSGRYDGIDLPGDTCRHLVLDGFPSGTTLIDRYFWSALNLTNTLRSLIACRVVQSLGRISRGMSDYGVVVITDKSYVKWLLVPKNLAALPEFVQKQIKLGFQVTNMASDEENLLSAAKSVLDRDDSWTVFYKKFMNDCEIECSDLDLDRLSNFAKLEAEFSKHYWERDFNSAAVSLREVLDQVCEFSAGLGAWYGLWVGYCCELLGGNSYEQIYKRAYGLSKSIPKYVEFDIDFTRTPVSEQVLNVSNAFTLGNGAKVHVPKKFHENLAVLDGSGSVRQVEEALRYLGELLGLDSTRPDNEHDIGPDNLWFCSRVGMAIEVKTNKDEGVNYSKKYIGQLSQHIQWVKEEVELDKLIPVFVGPVCAATESASPSEGMMVTNLASFKQLAEKLIATYEDISKSATPVTLVQEIEKVFSRRGLLWPDLIQKLELQQLKSL